MNLIQIKHPMICRAMGVHLHASEWDHVDITWTCFGPSEKDLLATFHIKILVIIEIQVDWFMYQTHFLTPAPYLLDELSHEK